MNLIKRVIPLLLLLSGFTAARGLEVTDSLGRTVNFDREPERIVLAGRALLMTADAVYLFPSAAHKIIAIEKITQGAKNFIPYVDPAYRKKIELPVEVGVEQIASLRPDLVLLKTYMRQKLGAPLERLGINVVYLNFENPEEYLEEIEMIGKILGSEKRAAEIIEYYQSRIDLAERTTAELTEGEKPSVLFISYSQRGGAVSFNVPPRSWLQSGLIELAGGSPVWDSGGMQQGWQTIGFEQVAGWDPDYIIVTSYFSDVDEVTEGLKKDPLWRSLKAVRSGNLLGFPADFFSWDQPDTRWILGLVWLARRLHPGRYPSLGIDEELRTFYREMYGITGRRFDEIVGPLLRGDIR